MMGHRARLRQRFREGGLQTLSQAQIIELLLFYTVPRRDTLPIAERLLERFGSLNGVFSADISDLTGVKGVSQASAVLLRAAADVYIEYAEPDFIGRISAEYPRTMERLFDNLSKSTKEAVIFAVFVDEGGFAARLERYPAESQSAERIAEAARRYGFAGAFVAVGEDFDGKSELSAQIAKELGTIGVECTFHNIM